MKNILFICESYKYNASPNGICVQRVAENLAENGHSVKVVTFFNGLGQPKEENINGVDVFRVQTSGIERRLYTNAKKETKKQSVIYNRTLKLSRINGLIRAFRYPLLSDKQVKNLYKKAALLHGEQPFDYAVCSYHKIPDILAGIRLKKRFKDIKLVLYTLDAISGGWVPNILHSRKIPMNSLKRWERYFFANIDKMFAMESHREYYNNEEYRKYADKTEYLDIPLLEPTVGKYDPDSKGESDAENQNEKKINLVYTGSMHKATANPQYLLKLMDKLDNAYLYIYGNISEDIESEIKENALFDERIFLCGRVSHDEIGQIQQKADILLNFGNDNSNMIPCKIFEYISTGNKILSFTHSPLDSSLPYIERYPNGLIVSEDDLLIDENAETINRFFDSEAEALSSGGLKQLYKKNTPEYFAGELFEV